MNANSIPAGYEIVAVKGLSELMYWLDRCSDKGHLENCPDLIDPYEAFDWRRLNTSSPSATSLAEAAEAGQVEAESLDMPGDDEAHNAWVSACEVDGIKYSGSAFERGWELSLSNGVPEWPTWANQILKVVREHSGYDGYDDQDGVDLVEETSECLRELAAMADRARADLAATPASPQAPAPQAVMGAASERYCLACEKLGHLTTECHSTHGLNTPEARELHRLCTIAFCAKSATPSPAPSAAPQEADSLREALADRLDAMADSSPLGSQKQSDLYAAATVWRKHINGGK